MVIPAEVRAELRAHAEEEAPNEACGLVVAHATASPSATCAAATPPRRPYRFELEVPPETWFLEDEGYELAVFHSHLSSPPRPSRTDVENIGLWQGRPYLILSLGADALAGWTIEDGRIEPLAVVHDRMNVDGAAPGPLALDGAAPGLEGGGRLGAGGRLRLLRGAGRDRPDRPARSAGAGAVLPRARPRRRAAWAAGIDPAHRPWHARSPRS